MPELPEVETFVQDLSKASLVGEKIVEASIFWQRTIATPNVDTFCDMICGQTLQKISRRGKLILFHLNTYTLFVHLRMTGKFSLSSKNEAERFPHERVKLLFSNGLQLHYQDQRKFGKWHLLKDPQEMLDKIGVEPLSDQFTLKTFQRLIKGRKMSIKPFLLNQKFVCGLGNIYVDEALFAAYIHPEKMTSQLSDEEIALLHQSIKTVLQQGVENRGTSLGRASGNYITLSGTHGTNQEILSVFRKKGVPCPRCTTSISKIIVCQRGTHFCPTCQR